MLAEKIFSLVKQIPKGKVTTYAELAKAIGNKKLARVVGRILYKNPKPIEIPCHRVVRSDGGVGGYKWGVIKKIELLRNEGIEVKNGKIVKLEKYFYRF